LTDLTTADMDTFFDDRGTRGCNVVNGPIMINLLDSITAVNGPISSTSPYTMRTQFFIDKVDPFVQKATAKGMTIFFPLCWGPNCKRDMMESAVNARTYANFVVSRYASYANIIWVIAGEYTKMADNAPSYVTQSDVMDANELAILDALIAGTMANKHVDSLVVLHPDGWKSTTDTDRHPARSLHNEYWNSFHVLQSARNNNENIIDTVYDTALSPTKPSLQAEIGYEEAGVTDPWHVRLGAWSSRLSGSAGFTYGHSIIWQFDTGWASHLGAAGADDIFTNFKAFWDEHQSETLIESRSWLTGDRGSSAYLTDTYEVAMRSADSTKLIVYAPQGANINVITNNISGTVRSRWYDPRLGTYTLISDNETKSADVTFDPSGSPGVDNDWVLVLD